MKLLGGLAALAVVCAVLFIAFDPALRERREDATRYAAERQRIELERQRFRLEQEQARAPLDLAGTLMVWGCGLGIAGCVATLAVQHHQRRARLVWPDERGHLPVPRADLERGALNEISADLLTLTKQVEALAAARPAVPAHFAPFTGDDDYAPLCASRTASIMRATRRLARRLGASALAGSVKRYLHELYLTLAPRGELRVRDVKRAVDHLCEALASAALPVRHAGSFGFDFVAVEADWHPLTRRNVIRIAPGDLPPGVLDEVADGIVRWFAAQHAGIAPPRKTAAAERARDDSGEPVPRASRSAP